MEAMKVLSALISLVARFDVMSYPAYIAQGSIYVNNDANGQSVRGESVHGVPFPNPSAFALA